jgi:hypothetical protein
MQCFGLACSSLRANRQRQVAHARQHFLVVAAQQFREHVKRPLLNLDSFSVSPIIMQHLPHSIHLGGGGERVDVINRCLLKEGKNMG